MKIKKIKKFPEILFRADLRIHREGLQTQEILVTFITARLILQDHHTLLYC